MKMRKPLTSQFLEQHSVTLEALEARLLLSAAAPQAPLGDTPMPDLSCGIGNITLPEGIVVWGDKGKATVTVTNVGDAPAVGKIDLLLSLSPDEGQWPTPAVLSAITDKSINLGAGQSKKFVFNYTLWMPPDLNNGDYPDHLPGNYSLRADINPVNIVEKDAGSDVNNTAISADTEDVELMFGNVGARTNVKLTVWASPDDDTLAIFSLKGPGTGKLIDAGGGAEMDIVGTTADSVVKITTKKSTPEDLGRMVGDVPVTVLVKTTDADSVGVGTLGSFIAPKTDLTGGVDVTAGLIGNLQLGDVAGGSIVYSSATPGDSAQMEFRSVSETDVNSPNVLISSITATEWLGGGTITAPALQSLKTTGAKANTKLELDAIPGDFEADLVLSGINFPVSKAALGKVSIASSLYGSSWDVTGSIGTVKIKGWVEDCQISSDADIASFAAGGISGSTLFAGVGTTRDDNGDGVFDLPIGLADFDAASTIKKFTIKGIKDEGAYVASFINSNIAARYLGNIKLCFAQLDNGGEPFGFAADFIKKISYKDADLSGSLSNLDVPGDIPAEIIPQLLDLEVRLF